MHLVNLLTFDFIFFSFALVRTGFALLSFMLYFTIVIPGLKVWDKLNCDKCASCKCFGFKKYEFPNATRLEAAQWKRTIQPAGYCIENVKVL